MAINNNKTNTKQKKKIHYEIELAKRFMCKRVENCQGK